MTSEEYRKSYEYLRVKLNEALQVKNKRAEKRIRNEIFQLAQRFWDEEGPPDIHSNC